VKRILLATMVTLIMLLIWVAPVLASQPPDNPGKSHPEFEKFVFVHYADSFARKGGSGNYAPQLYSYSGYHWNNNSLTYWVNLTGNRISDVDALTGIMASFQTWQADPVSQITFGYQGVTDAYMPGLNADNPDYWNVVGWAYLSDSYPDAIAITIVWATRGNKLIVDSDTVLNADVYFSWKQSNITIDPDIALLSPTTSYDADVQNIMTHEIGHWLQLNDLYSPASAEQTMYGYASDRELKKCSLELGDLAGIQKVYR
jgi:hypothetical protein